MRTLKTWSELPLTMSEERADEEMGFVRTNKLTLQQRKDKAETAERLTTYRKTTALGAYYRLANAANVPEFVIRQMVMANPVPYEYWLKVKQGLDSLEGVDDCLPATKSKRGETKRKLEYARTQ